ncbi:MAG: hypothetical protein IH936_02440 [Acidobacteria bacterium]|nr:hypothetical protein [Acidobacteriota bacterium]
MQTGDRNRVEYAIQQAQVFFFEALAPEQWIQAHAQSPPPRGQLGHRLESASNRGHAGFESAVCGLGSEAEGDDTIIDRFQFEQ